MKLEKHNEYLEWHYKVIKLKGYTTTSHQHLQAHVTVQC